MEATLSFASAGVESDISNGFVHMHLTASNEMAASAVAIPEARSSSAPAP